MKQLKENTGIRNNPVIQLNTSIHSNNTLSTPKNIMIEKNSKNRNYRNTINLNNLHNTINLLTTNTQMFNSVISTNVKTPKSLNDYENSLNLINFKLNCDILQNKINRLNSLIPSNNYEFNNYTPSHSERAGTTTAKNFSKFHHRRNDIKILNDQSSANDYLNIMINSTKERLNEYLNRTHGTKGFRLHTESENTATVTYLPTLTYSKSGIEMDDSDNSKSGNYLSNESELEKSDFMSNINELNSTSKKKNSKFKTNHPKDLYIETSISKIDLLTESVQQFCITPTPTNIFKDLKFTNTEILSGKNKIHNSFKFGTSVDINSNLKLNNLEEQEKYSKDNEFMHSSTNDKILIENQNNYLSVDQSKPEAKKNCSCPPSNYQHLEIQSFSSENVENNRSRSGSSSKSRSRSINLSELADDLIELKEGQDNQVSSQHNSEKKIHKEDQNISQSRSLCFSESHENSPKKTISRQLSINESQNSKISQNDVPLSEDELIEGFTPRSLRKKIISKENHIKTNSNSDNINNLHSVPLQNETSANGRKSRNNTYSYNEINMSRNINSQSQSSETENFKIEENGFTPSDKDPHHKKTQSCESDREASLIINQIIQNNKTEPFFKEESEVSEHRRKVRFAQEDIVIVYREKDLIQHLYVKQEDGKYVRHKRKDFNTYIRQLKSKRRPKSIITRFSLNLQEKEMALQKLNNLIVECDDESSCEKINQYKYPRDPTEISKNKYIIFGDSR